MIYVCNNCSNKFDDSPEPLAFCPICREKLRELCKPTVPRVTPLQSLQEVVARIDKLGEELRKGLSEF